MKAAVLNAFGDPLAIETLPDPVPGPGEVIVDVVAAGVTSYAADVFNGSRNYPLELPVAPGAGGIGRVRATGPDATRLRVGDWVFCDPTIRARDNAANPDIDPPGLDLQDRGGLAPASALSPRLLRRADAGPDRERHADRRHRPGARRAAGAALGRLLVPYGGLLAGDLKAGETLVVNGATGGFGGAGVAVALAMGAGRVVAAGRNAQHPG